jgi:hypothetical protein
MRTSPEVRGEATFEIEAAANCGDLTGRLFFDRQSRKLRRIMDTSLRGLDNPRRNRFR